MNRMRVFVEGVGLLGPGLPDWQKGCAVLAGSEPYIHAPATVAASSLLPPAERRRTGVPIKLALAVGHEAFTNAGRDASMTATVFTSSGGDNDNLHHICEALATPEREVSPTRFHNSVHNAAAGYWSIAARSQAPSTSLCAHDGSFAAGLLEAATEVVVDGHAVALIAYDHPYPQPLHAVREISGNFGAALVLSPQLTEQTIGCLDIDFVAESAVATSMNDPALEVVRTSIPAARSLPLLSALARGAAETIVIEYLDGNHLRVAVTP